MLGKILKQQYQIVEMLGSGGFCETYLARNLDQLNDPNCVVKHLSTTVNRQPQALASLRHLFTREAQALEKLGSHDRVPQLIAHFEEEEEFYLVQQFIPGHPLNAELQTARRWSDRQVIELLQEVLEILAYVHSHGLIHRDIKPTNLIRRRSDQRLVLIDFGSVKHAWRQVVTSQGKTSAKFVEGIPATIAIGTPGYMPTEQGRGRPRPSSDIYALGMVGIQALTGCSPSQLLEDPETGETLWQTYADTSPQLAAILSQMVRYHFKDRYQSATEVLQALESLTTQLVSATVNGRRTAPPRSPLATAAKPQLSTTVLGKRSPTANTNTDNTPSDRENKLVLLIGLAIGIASAIALMAVSYYSLQPNSPAIQLPPASDDQDSSSAVAAVRQSAIAAKLTPVRTLTGHTDAVWSVAVSPDGQTLVSGSEDKTIKLWQLSTGQIWRTLKSNSEQVLSVAFSPDGQSLTSGSFATANAIRTWQLQTGELHRQFSPQANKVWSVDISSNGETLASTSGERGIKIWHLPTGELRQSLKGHTDTVWSVKISPDGKFLASGSKDKTIKVWHLPTGRLLHTLTDHTNRVRAVAISPDSRILVSSSWDQTIKIWHLQTGKLLHTLNSHSGYVNAVAISPDGQTIASGSDDNTIKLWHLQTGELLHTLSGHTHNVNSVAFTADGQTLVSASADKTIKIWQP